MVSFTTDDTFCRKEAPEHLSALRFQYAAGDLHMMIKGRVLAQGVHAAAAALPLIPRAKDHPVHLCHQGRTGAHGAKLQGDIQGAPVQMARAQGLRRPAHGQYLGMGRRVSPLALVMGAGDHAAVPDDQRPHRHLVFIQLRLLKRKAHPFFAFRDPLHFLHPRAESIIAHPILFIQGGRFMNETLSTIKNRRSHRAYAATKLTEEQLQLILDAAMQSPSAVNRQPRHFTVCEDQALLGQINAELRRVAMAQDEGKRSPRFQQSDFDVFYHAPCVIFIFGEPDFAWTQVDCGIAVENIALAAESLGLGSVILGLPRMAFEGEHKQELLSRLGCPEGWDFVIAISIGTATDTKAAHPLRENSITRL